MMEEAEAENAVESRFLVLQFHQLLLKFLEGPDKAPLPKGRSDRDTAFLWGQLSGR